MWVLYSIKRNNNEFRDSLVSRLRPSQTYLILKRGKYDPNFTASIILPAFPEKEVVSKKTSTKPAIFLTQIKSQKMEALVDDRTVNTEHSLLGESIIRVSTLDVRFRLKWENFTIAVDNVDEEEYERLLKLGAMLGICVVKEYTKAVTHVYVSEEPQQEEVTDLLLKGLANEKLFITKKWIDSAKLERLDQDRKLNVKALNDTIEPIVWKDIGPCKGQNASLGPNPRRKTLFEDTEFVIVDEFQKETLPSYIEKCGGTWRFVDLTSDQSVKFNHKSLLLRPREVQLGAVPVVFETVDVEKWDLLLAKYHDQTGNGREIWETEIVWAIVYCATNFMCNPASSLSSVIPSMNADKKSRPNCSFNATVPYSVDSNLDEGGATVRYNTEEPSLRDTTNVATMPYDANQATVPYDANEEVDVKLEPSTQSSAGTQHRESSPMHDETVPQEATLASETASIYETAPINNTARTHSTARTQEAVATAHTSINNDDQSIPHSPVREMSPVAPLPPEHEAASDLQVHSPLLSVSPEPEISHYEGSLDEGSSLMDPMADLNNFFSDFVGSMKAKPPPKKASANPPPDAVEEPTATEAAPPQVRSSPVRSFSPEPIPRREEPIATQRSPSPIPPSRSPPHVSTTADLSDHEDETPTPLTGKRILPSADTPRSVKRLKVISREEELAEEEAEEAKTEPTTPPAYSASDQSNMEAQREEQVGEYSKVIYAPLVANPRPPPMSNNSTQQPRRGNGVNYKKFKKVKQFEYENEMDIVYMVTSSQTTREQQAQQQRRPRVQSSGTRIEDTNIFDTDLYIKPVRRT